MASEGFLRPGNTIGVVSPASAAPAESFAAAEALIERRGYESKFFSSPDDRQGRLAGNDALRTRQLIAALVDPTVDAVFCMRGGYGSARIIDNIPDSALLLQQKPFVGYSDITTILNHMVSRGRKNVFHGPMLKDLVSADDPCSEKYLFDVLEGRSHELSLKSNRIKIINEGECSGPIIGGNISIIESIIGTNSYYNKSGFILLLEEVNEPAYRLDRSINHLKRAGVFDKCCGVILSEMVGPDIDDVDCSLGVDFEELLAEHFYDFGDRPVVANVPCGHTQPQLTLPFGATLNMRVDRDSFRLGLSLIEQGELRKGDATETSSLRAAA